MDACSSSTLLGRTALFAITPDLLDESFHVLGDYTAAVSVSLVVASPADARETVTTIAAADPAPNDEDNRATAKTWRTRAVRTRNGGMSRTPLAEVSNEGTRVD